MNQTPVRSGIRIPAMLLLCFACMAMTEPCAAPATQAKDDRALDEFKPFAR